MIRDQITLLGCGQNKAKYAGKMKYCIENGLDFKIYRLGPERIRKMVLRRFGIELAIDGRDLHTITREAQEIIYP